MAAVSLKSGSVLLPSVGMSQSGLMVAALIGGFVVYLAMQGKLQTYWTLMTGGGGSAATTAAPAATTTTPGATTTTPSTTTPGATTPSPTTPSTTTPNPFSFLGGTANPFAAATGGVGYNATKPGIFSGLTPGSLFSGGS